MVQVLKQFLAFCIGIGFALTVNSQSYPNKTIKIVMPSGAGSGSDTVARISAQNLVESFKQPVIVENRPGANGVIAAEFVAKSAPDGYTLFITTNTTHSANPSLLKSIPYDPIKDFAPVARLGNFFPNMLVVDPKLPVKSVAEFVAYAKAHPGKLSYATSNSTAIIASSTFARMAGIDMLHVPYKSAPPAMNDVMGGQVSMMFLEFMTGLNNVKAGKIRPLGVIGDKPNSLLPDLPALARMTEFQGFTLWAWLGVFAPAGTPPEVINVLNREFVKIVTRKDLVEKLAALGFDAFGSTPEELSVFVASELIHWAKLIKDAGIRPQ